METSLAKAAHAVKHLGEVISALLNAQDAPKPVKDLLHHVGAVVANVTRALSDAIGALVGGGGSHHGPYGQMLHHVGAVVANVARTLGDAIGTLVGGGGGGAPHPLSGSPVISDLVTARPLLAFYGLPERVSAAVSNLARAAGGSLGGSLGASGAQHTTHQTHRSFPAAPTAPPLPQAPSLPVPVAPGGYMLSLLLGGFGSGGEAFPLLFAVMVVFSGALLRGGRLSWLRRESHGPPTALAFAIERPG
jgi:hypothetical protein